MLKTLQIGRGDFGCWFFHRRTERTRAPFAQRCKPGRISYVKFLAFFSCGWVVRQFEFPTPDVCAA
jgi:hypothetical protein